ncbi:MAG: HisA/HisF-related TIM barrel protein [Pseudomonadota bacterium]
MKLIPVCDLMNGVAVHAVRGLRDRYKPVTTPLCKDCSPFAVIDAFLTLHDFKDFYLADLNALTHQGNQADLISRIRATYPSLTFWVDRGRRAPSHEFWPNMVEVVGSESLNREALPALLDTPKENFLLSLDNYPDRLLGPPGLFEDDRYWPDRIIIMTLGRVGSNSGPDFTRIAHYYTRWPDRKFIAAGGVRDDQDIRRLEDMGAYAVLVASALHLGNLGPSVLSGSRN